MTDIQPDYTPFLNLVRPDTHDDIRTTVNKLRDALDAVDAWAAAQGGGTPFNYRLLTPDQQDADPALQGGYAGAYRVDPTVTTLVLADCTDDSGNGQHFVDVYLKDAPAGTEITFINATPGGSAATDPNQDGSFVLEVYCAQTPDGSDVQTLRGTGYLGLSRPGESATLVSDGTFWNVKANSQLYVQGAAWDDQRSASPLFLYWDPVNHVVAASLLTLDQLGIDYLFNQWWLTASLASSAGATQNWDVDDKVKLVQAIGDSGPLTIHLPPVDGITIRPGETFIVKKWDDSESVSVMPSTGGYLDNVQDAAHVLGQPFEYAVFFAMPGPSQGAWALIGTGPGTSGPLQIAGHDVLVGTLNDKDLIQFNGTSGNWEDVGPNDLGLMLPPTVFVQPGSADLTGTPARTETILLLDAATGNATVTLPARVPGAGGIKVTVKKIDDTANTVTINCTDGGSIDGVLTQVLSAQYQSLSLVCRDDATPSEWLITGGWAGI